MSDTSLSTALGLWVALGSVHLALITVPVALINYVRSLPLANVLLRLRVLCFHRRICDLQHSHTDVLLLAHALDCVSRMGIALFFFILWSRASRMLSSIARIHTHPLARSFSDSFAKP